MMNGAEEGAIEQPPTGKRQRGPEAPTAFPLFTALPASIHSGETESIVPFLQSIVTRHLAAVEALCTASGVSQGSEFLEATRTATSALLEGAKKLSLAQSNTSKKEANPKNVSNRAKLSILRKQKAAYQGEVGQWTKVSTKYSARKEVVGEVDLEEEDMDNDLLRSHLGEYGGESSNMEEGSIALTTLVDVREIPTPNCVIAAPQQLNSAQ